MHNVACVREVIERRQHTRPFPDERHDAPLQQEAVRARDGREPRAAIIAKVQARTRDDK